MEAGRWETGGDGKGLGGKCCWLSLQWLQKSCFNCPSGQELKSDPKNSLNVDGVMSGKD